VRGLAATREVKSDASGCIVPTLRKPRRVGQPSDPTIRPSFASVRVLLGKEIACPPWQLSIVGIHHQIIGNEAGAASPLETASSVVWSESCRGGPFCFEEQVRIVGTLRRTIGSRLECCHQRALPRTPPPAFVWVLLLDRTLSKSVVT